MSLTLSDGYVIYTDGKRDFDPFYPGKAHIWYPFWDADFGYPVGSKAQTYQNIVGATS